MTWWLFFDIGISSKNSASGSTGYTRSTVVNAVNRTRVNRNRTDKEKKRAEINRVTRIGRTVDVVQPLSVLTHSLLLDARASQVASVPDAEDAHVCHCHLRDFACLKWLALQSSMF
jgi:hypothetical protein